MKLHITEAEEASPTQDDGEDYGYGPYVSASFASYALNLPRVGLSTAIEIRPGSWSRTNHVQAFAPQSAGSGARAKLRKEKIPKAGICQRCQGDRMVGVTGIEPVTPTMST